MSINTTFYKQSIVLLRSSQIQQILLNVQRRPSPLPLTATALRHQSPHNHRSVQPKLLRDASH